MQYRDPNTRSEFWHQHHVWYWVLLVAFALACLMLLMFANVQFERDYRDSQTVLPVNSKEQAVIIRVWIDFGTRARAFEGEAEKGMTLESALRQIAEVGKMALTIRNGQIAVLEGQRSENGKRWNIYVNNEASSNLYRELRGGDRIALRYE